MTGCGSDRECIHSPEEHRGAARIGRAKIAFFERDNVHSSPYLNMRMYFIVLRKGIFLKPFQGLTKHRQDGVRRHVLPLRNGTPQHR